MWNIFRRNSQPTPQVVEREKSEKVNDSIFKLRGTIEKLQKKQAHKEKQIEALQNEAKAALKKKRKKAAMQALKMKKMHEKSVKSFEAQILNLEVQIMTLEEALMNSQTLTAMSTARDAMTSMVNEDTIERVENLKDDMEEAQDQLAEFNEIMSRPMIDMDDDDLLAELDALEEDDLDLEILDANQQRQKVQPQVEKKTQLEVIDETMPEEDVVSAPTKPIAIKELTEEEARDLKELDQMELVMSAQIVVEKPATCAMDVDMNETSSRANNWALGISQ